MMESLAQRKRLRRVSRNLFKTDGTHYSMLDVRCSTFIGFFINLTGLFFAGGWAEH